MEINWIHPRKRFKEPESIELIRVPITVDEHKVLALFDIKANSNYISQAYAKHCRFIRIRSPHPNLLKVADGLQKMKLGYYTRPLPIAIH